MAMERRIQCHLTFAAVAGDPGGAGNDAEQVIPEIFNF
jgi:hypothetical protein